MVLVECKRLPKEEYSKDYDVFLVQIPAATNIGEATDLVQKIQNIRVRLQWMTAAAKQIAKDYCSEDQKHYMLGPVGDTEAYLSLERAEKREVTTLEELNNLVESFKGGAMILFPAECSGNDACKRLTDILENDDTSEPEKSKAHRILSIIDDYATNDKILTGAATMWWSGKPLAKDADFIKYVGKNEKTKITVKLTPEGAGAPPREPAVDAKTQAELMAHYYKKQEEMKKIIEDEDLSFGNSEWANPKGLKKQLMGVDNVKYRPM